MPASVSDSVWAWTQLSLWPKISPHGSSEWDRPHRPQAHSPKNTEQLSHSSSRSFTSTKQTQELTQEKNCRGLGDGCAHKVMQCCTVSVEKQWLSTTRRFQISSTPKKHSGPSAKRAQLQISARKMPSDFSLETKTSSGCDWISSVCGGVGEIH